jgi:hypothetical protein
MAELVDATDLKVLSFNFEPCLGNFSSDCSQIQGNLLKVILSQIGNVYFQEVQRLNGSYSETCVPCVQNLNKERVQFSYDNLKIRWFIES